jgi:hypothetical protein
MDGRGDHEGSAGGLGDTLGDLRLVIDENLPIDSRKDNLKADIARLGEPDPEEGDLAKLLTLKDLELETLRFELGQYQLQQ